MTAWEDYITLDPEILVGKPIIRNTRLAVALVVELLAQGWAVDDILVNYPGLTVQDVRACLAYAADLLRHERLYPFQHK